jgi:hypothetical protein
MFVHIFVCLSFSIWGVEHYSKKLKVLRMNFCYNNNSLKYYSAPTLLLAFLRFAIKFGDGIYCVFGTCG